MKDLSKVKRVVIKIGTNAIMKDNRLNKQVINELAKEISAHRRQGVNFIVVSSGAIGLGVEKLNLNHSDALPFQQATASVGQSILMNEFSRAFSKYNQVISQMLLTHNDFEDRVRLATLKKTIDKLMELNVVPIINENDVVSVEELKTDKGFSDNDMLSVLVAEAFSAELLIMLSDVDGLYTDDPKNNKKAKKIDFVEDVSDVRKLPKGASFRGKGGFSGKLDALQRAGFARISSIVCAFRKGAISKILANKPIGTRFFL